MGLMANRLGQFRFFAKACGAVLALNSHALALEATSLKGPDIIDHLAGKSVRGTYADGTPFTETFWPDGKDTYWDPRGSSSGTWRVSEDMMCFTYDAVSNMSGGCFRVEKIGANCFDFYAVSQPPGLDPRKGGPRYTARASADGAPETCPDELQV